MVEVLQCAWLAGVVACASAAGPTGAPKSADEPTAELALPADLEEHIARAQRIGATLYLEDKLAAIGTDVLRANLDPLEGRGLAGYIVVREAEDAHTLKDSWMVMFYTNEESPRVAYEIRVAPDRKPDFMVVKPPRAPNALLLQIIAARRAAIEALLKEVGNPPPQPVNPLVFPAEIDGEQGHLVYLLAGTTKPDTAVFGKQHRALVTPDGNTVRNIYGFTNTALEMPTRGPEGQKPEGLMVTQIVTDWPTEIHVFVSLLHKMPVYVGTRRGIWRVDGDQIALIREEPPEGMRQSRRPWAGS